MHQIEKLIQSTITAFFVLVATNAALAETSSTEKCYGIVKTGMNDCATSTASCAGSATQDNQKDAFLLMPW